MGTPGALSPSVRFCELLPPGLVRSCGLLRFVRSCGLVGLTPGPRPVVDCPDGDGVARPLGDVVDEPVVGPLDVPGPVLRPVGLVAELPEVPVSLPLLPDDAPLLPELPLPLPLELWATARLADRINMAIDVLMIFMRVFPFAASIRLP